MFNVSKKMKYFYLIVVCLLLIGVGFGCYIFLQKPTYKLVNERTIENYPITYNNNTYTGVLYEQDILYRGRLTSDLIEKYILSVKTPLDVNIVKVKFYSSYDNNIENQSIENLRYEIQKIVD